MSSNSTVRRPANRRLARFAQGFALAALLGGSVAAQPVPFFNRNIPQECHDKMVAFNSAGHQILCVAFPPAGGNSWTIITDRSFYNRNVPQECHDRMISMRNAGHKLLCVAYPPAGGNRWTIVSDRGYFNRNVPTECHTKMGEFWAAGHKVRCVAYPPAGGNSWSVVTDRGFFNRNIPQECHDRMRTFHSAGQLVRWVAFPRAGGNRWTVLTDRSLYNRNVASEAHTVMLSFLRSSGSIGCVAYDDDGNGFSIVGRHPQLSLSSATTSIENVTRNSIDVRGTNLDRTTGVTFGRYRITRTDSSDPTLSYFSVLSSTRVFVHLPQALTPGDYSMRLTATGSTSNARNVRVVRTAQPRILVTPSVDVPDSYRAYIAAGNAAASQAWLAVSPDQSASTIPGVIDLDIGARFSTLVILPAPAAVSSTTGAARFSLPSVPSMRGTRLWFQGILVTRNLPFAVTDISLTRYR